MLLVSPWLEEDLREATEAKDSRRETVASMLDDVKLGTLTLIGLGLIKGHPGKHGGEWKDYYYQYYNCV